MVVRRIATGTFPFSDWLNCAIYQAMANKVKIPAKTGRTESAGRFMGVKIAKPAVMPLKVSEATIREAVRSVVDERRAQKP